MSRSLTYTVPSIKASPSPKTNNSNIYKNNNGIDQDSPTPFIKVNIKTTHRLMPKLISAEIDPATTTIYFGKLIFLNKSPWLTTDFKPPFVTSAKKLHMTVPNNSATGQ